MCSYGNWFSDKEVTGFCQIGNDKNLISTYQHGIFITHGNQLKEWSAQLANIWKNEKILSFIQTSKGQYLIGTESNGLYLITENGELLLHLSMKSGLKSNKILCIYEDSFGNVWVGHSNGISKIELSSPFTYVDSNMGMNGTGYCALATEKHIYYGTNNGLYVQPKNQKALSDLEKIEEITGQVYGLSELDGDVLV
jgi:ligand-binding sensor domain-containing protein